MIFIQQFSKNYSILATGPGCRVSVALKEAAPPQRARAASLNSGPESDWEVRFAAELAAAADGRRVQAEPLSLLRDLCARPKHGRFQMLFTYAKINPDKS
jgi:hypothetical protein